VKIVSAGVRHEHTPVATASWPMLTWMKPGILPSANTCKSFSSTRRTRSIEWCSDIRPSSLGMAFRPASSAALAEDAEKLLDALVIRRRPLKPTASGGTHPSKKPASRLISKRWICLVKPRRQHRVTPKSRCLMTSKKSPLVPESGQEAFLKGDLKV
jgi:hypothetical protein